MRCFHGAFWALRTVYVDYPSDVYDRLGMFGMPDRKPCRQFQQQYVSTGFTNV